MRQTKALIVFIILICLPSATEARKVRIAVATLSQSVLPLVVAQEKGYFKEEDLEVELVLTTASVANMALLGGHVDFISSGTRYRRNQSQSALKICVGLFQSSHALALRKTRD